MKDLKLQKLLVLLCLAVAVFLLLPACSFFGGGKEESQAEESLPEEEEDPEYPLSIAGAELSSRPGKVVSLAPSLTEKLFDLARAYDLSIAERLVGVSDYCDVIPDAAGLPSCGTAILPDLDTIGELAPRLILTQTQLSEDALTALQQMDIEVAVLPHAGSLEELYNVYRDISMLLEGKRTGGEIGDAFAARFQSRLAAIADAVAPWADDPVPVLYLRELDFVVAGGDTVEHELIEAAGMSNIAADQSGWSYPEGQPETEEVRAAFESIELIFCDDNTVNIKDLEQSAYYKGLTAVLKDWYLYIDATVFERQGMAMLDQLEWMAQACYPESGLTSKPEDAPEAETADPVDDADSGAE